MASKIGVIEQEYESLIHNLQTIHDNNIDQIQIILGELETLNERGGGFYLKEMTPKVDQIVDELKKIAETMHTAYEANERAIQSFVSAVDNYDTMC